MELEMVLKFLAENPILGFFLAIILVGAVCSIVSAVCSIGSKHYHYHCKTCNKDEEDED